MILNWVEGFEINVRIENGAAVISANREGLLSLANHLKSLAEEPPGTLGLIIDKFHPSVMGFRSERWTTPPWYDILTHSDLAILDRLPIQPVVQMIDNVERNHKLGMLFECNVSNGRLLVCTSRLGEILDRPEVRWFTKCLLEYANSPEFQPSETISETAFDNIFN